MIKNRIFISYKRVDKEKVFKLKDRIEDAIRPGLCWVDLDGIESDAQFADVIVNAINRAEVFLFMYSSAHSKIKDYSNDWTVREILYAHKKKKRIVFINLDGSPLTDWFELIFGTQQHVDSFSVHAVAKLIDDLRNWLSIKLTVEQIAEEIAQIDKEVGDLTLLMSTDGKYGYKNRADNVVIPAQWEEAWPFHAGLARVRNADKKIGYIDKKGNLRIDYQWADAKRFFECLAAVKNDKDDWGYINLLGEVVIPCQWRKANDFKDGIAIVQTYSGKSWNIDKSGHNIGYVPKQTP